MEVTLLVGLCFQTLGDQSPVVSESKGYAVWIKSSFAT